MSRSYRSDRVDNPGRRRVRRAFTLGTAFVVLVVSVATAAWIIGSTAGVAAARATTLPAVTGVAATTSGQHSATLSWQLATLPDGAGPAKYEVLAYPAGGGDARSPQGTCAGTNGLVEATTCKDSNIPGGSWVYRVAVHLGAWTGPASNPSEALTFPTAANDIVAENQQQGSPASEWDVQGAGDSTIQGFTTDISTDQGGTVSFKVDPTATQFRIDIYRLGWYGGDGARKVATIPASQTTATVQDPCRRDGTGIADCGN